MNSSELTSTKEVAARLVNIRVKKAAKNLSREVALELANDLPDPEKKLTYYKDVLIVLYADKGLTGKQIQKWLRENDCGEYSLSRVYKMLRKLSTRET